MNELCLFAFFLCLVKTFSGLSCLRQFQSDETKKDDSKAMRQKDKNAKVRKFAKTQKRKNAKMQKSQKNKE